ncbi:MAG: hypothetical protein WD738_19145 [Pirellulales bacterium]
MRSAERGARSEWRPGMALTCVFMLVANPPVVAAPFSFDDIKYWVGDGMNRAALVIDWVENSTEPPALAWGFRWDGNARGSDMLAAIVAADPRLFAKLGGTRANPQAVYGLGYDDDDGEFGVDDGTMFDSEGFAFTGPADLAMATDSDDYYAEGWFTGFWHYGTEAPDGTNPFDDGYWANTTDGMASRDLIDGAWDSWAFSPSFNFAAFAENPQAAMPPDAQPGDFNRDGSVDVVDYDLWRHTFGSMSELAADGNGNQVVDAADYVMWRANANPRTAAHRQSARPVPEPTPRSLAVLCLLIHVALYRNR